MARFSLRPKMINTQANQGVISIPEPVDDNQYLAASAQAAIADKTSGAYDQYMFTDSELQQMPYEAAVDTHLQLVSTRLKQRYGRALTAKRNQVLRRQGRRDTSQRKTSAIGERLLLVQNQLEEHRKILLGSSPGRHGLQWTGHEPDFLGSWKARTHLLIRALILISVGAVDLYVIWATFVSLGIPSRESAFLTAPAVAAQLAFPHLAGVRLAKLMRGSSQRAWLRVETSLILLIWLAFIGVMAFLRVDWLSGVLEDETGDKLPFVLWVAVLVLNLVLLTALGGWLIFLAIRENPHERAALACKLQISKLESKRQRADRKLSKSQTLLEIAISNLSALEEELEDSITASRVELSLAAKAVYRRALVNQLADVDFTSAYLAQKDLKR